MKRLILFIKSSLAYSLRMFFAVIYKIQLKFGLEKIDSIFYESYLWEQIIGAVNKKLFTKNEKNLPKNFGSYMSERIVEIPLFFSKINDNVGIHLDAGSSLNFLEGIEILSSLNKKIVVMNLNPERDCFWDKGVSYVFSDLRKKFFNIGAFDSISCISVLEHVGLDNSRYTKEDSYKQNLEKDYLKVIGEFKRILKKMELYSLRSLLANIKTMVGCKHLIHQ